MRLFAEILSLSVQRSLPGFGETLFIQINATHVCDIATSLLQGFPIALPTALRSCQQPVQFCLTGGLSFVITQKCTKFPIC